MDLNAKELLPLLCRIRAARLRYEGASPDLLYKWNLLHKEAAYTQKYLDNYQSLEENTRSRLKYVTGALRDCHTAIMKRVPEMVSPCPIMVSLYPKLDWYLEPGNLDGVRASHLINACHTLTKYFVTLTSFYSLNSTRKEEEIQTLVHQLLDSLVSLRELEEGLSIVRTLHIYLEKRKNCLELSWKTLELRYGVVEGTLPEETSGEPVRQDVFSPESSGCQR